MSSYRPSPLAALLNGLGGSLPDFTNALVKRKWAGQDAQALAAEKRREEEAKAAAASLNDQRDTFLWSTRNSTMPMADQFALESAMGANKWDLNRVLGQEDQAASTEEMLQRMTGEQKAQPQNFTLPTSSTPRTFGAGFSDVPRKPTGYETSTMNAKGNAPGKKSALSDAGFVPKVKPQPRRFADALEKASIYRRPTGGSGSAASGIFASALSKARQEASSQIPGLDKAIGPEREKLLELQKRLTREAMTRIYMGMYKERFGQEVPVDVLRGNLGEYFDTGSYSMNANAGAAPVAPGAGGLGWRVVK